MPRGSLGQAVESVKTQARLLPLQGGHNFRDLGGYATRDGRQVRWRQLFRSGTLAHLTPADHGCLAALNIRTVCDLRTTAERNSEPSSWTPSAGRTMTWDYELDGGAVMGVFRVGTPTPERVRAAITEFYLTAPEDFADRLSAVFRVLGAQEAPLVMHCTAGKDRPGVAAAIVLRALGVSTQAVIEDYVLSASLLDLQQLYGGRNFQRRGSWEFLSTLPPEIRAPLIAAEPEYIEAMLGALDQRYGSVDGYLASRLGVTDAALGHIRELYLHR